MAARGTYTNIHTNLAGGDGLRTKGITAIAAGRSRIWSFLKLTSQLSVISKKFGLGTLFLGLLVLKGVCAHAPPGLPRLGPFAALGVSAHRNGTSPSVIARHSCAEAISKLVAISLQPLADC